MYVYSIFDYRSMRYSPLYVETDDVIALRVFEWSKKGTILEQFPNEFELRRIGTFNNVTGEIKGTVPESVLIGGQNETEKNERSEGQEEIL